MNAQNNYLSGLNAPQKEAVQHIDGPLLIIAGAGAGKTRVITHRVLHLIESGVSPRNVLAITFTNKAAKEMRERVQKLLTEDPTLQLPVTSYELPTTCTFHALGVRILRESGQHIDVPKHFSIYDESDALSVIKSALKSLDLDPKQFEPKRIKNTISRSKGDLIDQKRYTADAGNDYFPRIVAQVWDQYEKQLKAEKGLDFDDLLLKTVQLLREDAEVRGLYQKRYQHIHVDEYQDTNVAQYELSKLLTDEKQNICVVGDMDQSVYSWRGADFRNILNFEHDFPNAKTVLLEENYRSTKTILAAANEIIKKNEERKEKNLFTNKEDGDRIGLFGAYDEAEEAVFIAERSKQLIESGAEPQDIAVLYRANFQSRVLEDAFLRADIPYQVLGVKFFARKEIKDVLSFISAGLNPDSAADIKRVINVPPRGIGKVTVAKIFAGLPAEASAQVGEREKMTGAMKQKVDDFFALLSTIGTLVGKEKPSTVISTVIKKSGMHDAYRKGSEEDVERLENMYELAALAERYDDLPPEEGMEKLLEDAALASDQDSMDTQRQKEQKNAVRLMTVHAAKGLEFPYVFISGMEQGLFPHEGFADSAAAKERAEEERRLFYVAITRAEKKAFLSYASTRMKFGMKEVCMPSEFIIDIPDEFMEEESIPEHTIHI